MENSTWNDRVRNEEVLDAVKEDRTILQTMEIRKATGLVI
jgi:hypothetical protein